MKGFSLLEVLVTLALISIIVFASDFALVHSNLLNAHITQNYKALFSKTKI